MKYFHFDWKRHSWKDVISTDLGSKTHFLNQKDCFGLYYITGSHFIYGTNTLLYFGKAQEQRFGYRLNQHSDFDITNLPNIHSFYTGKLLQWDDGNHENWSQAIELSEMLMINSHIPALNASGVKWVLDKDKYGEITVFNWGEHDLILPEVSGYRFSLKYWDQDMYKKQYLSE